MRRGEWRMAEKEIAFDSTASVCHTVEHIVMHEKN